MNWREIKRPRCKTAPQKYIEGELKGEATYDIGIRDVFEDSVSMEIGNDSQSKQLTTKENIHRQREILTECKNIFYIIDLIRT